MDQGVAVISLWIVSFVAGSLLGWSISREPRRAPRRVSSFSLWERELERPYDWATDGL